MCDRAIYVQAGRGAAEYAVARLGEQVGVESYRAGQEGRIWGEMAKAGIAHAWDKNREIEDWIDGGTKKIEVEDVDTYVQQVAVVLGIRVGQVTGVTQGAHWERKRDAVGGWKGKA